MVVTRGWQSISQCFCHPHPNRDYWSGPSPNTHIWLDLTDLSKIVEERVEVVTTRTGQLAQLRERHPGCRSALHCENPFV